MNKSTKRGSRMTAQAQTKQNLVTENAVKLVGEAFIPGASLLMEGKILEGGAHVVVGALARMALGPVGLALVIANSFSKSTTGKSLLKQFTGDKAGKAHAEK
jgi:hypothetical protein